MRLKICLMSDHHVCINPRLWKEAFYFEKKGFDVVILIKLQDAEMKEKDLQILQGSTIQYKSYLNLIPGEIKEIKRFYYRARRKFASLLQKRFNIGTSWSINHSPKRMLTFALKENAYLYVAHLESAFYVGRELILNNKKVAYDFEDWYSRDYLVPERPVKLLSQLERFALNNGLYCTTTSKSMADAIQNEYKSSNSLTVIYNGFSTESESSMGESEPHSFPYSNLKVLWFSRSIGPNRGIEYFIEALKTINVPIELTLLGEIDLDYKDFLNKNFPFNDGHLLSIHPFIAHSKLDNFISQFDIGLAIEENINDNKALTISNKILQYLQAGLPVLATATKGQIEVANYFPDTIKIVDIKHPLDWKYALSALMDISKKKRVQQKEIYSNKFSWEAQEVKFDHLLKKYLNE